MNPHLDDWLGQQLERNIRSKRRLLRFFLDAYKVCVPDYINRPKTDLTSAQNEFTFHLGSPLSDLRTVASWVLTHHPRRRSVAKCIPALWKRHGREDLTMAGLLLANVGSEALGEDPWIAFIHLLQRREPLMIVLEVAEELVRAGHPVPEDEWLLAAGEQSPSWHQFCLLFLSLRKHTSPKIRAFIQRAPPGGELFERIRLRLLSTED